MATRTKTKKAAVRIKAAAKKAAVRKKAAKKPQPNFSGAIPLAKDESPEPKKMPWWQELALNMLIPAILIYGTAAVARWMEKAWEENQRLVTMMLVSIYPFIDVYVEKYAEATKTKVDDKAVDTIKGLLESFAAAHEIELPNQDDD